MESILEVKNVNKIYGTTITTQVLTDINVGFEKGSFNSIIGQSGSGKSTYSISLVPWTLLPQARSILKESRLQKCQKISLRNYEIKVLVLYFNFIIYCLSSLPSKMF